ncbi:MAG TPA: cytochrome c oxidase assembly factor Coa1 family protein, partial [Blastocatellia bacterium]
ARTRSNADAVRELGEPIESGWLISGQIKTNDSFGMANLSIPVSGPKKSGKVYVVAAKRMGKWDISALELEIEGEASRINLLPPTIK